MRLSHTKAMLLTVIFASASIFCGKGNASENTSKTTTKPGSPISTPSTPSSVSSSSTPDATPRQACAAEKRLAIVTAASVLGFASSSPKPSCITPGSRLASSTPIASPRPLTPAYPAAPQPSPSTPSVAIPPCPYSAKPMGFFKPETPFGSSPSASSAPRPSKLKTAASMVVATTPADRRAPPAKEPVATYMRIISEIQLRVRKAGRLEQHMFWFDQLVKVLEKARLYREFTIACSTTLEEKKAPLLEDLMQAEKNGEIEIAGEIRLKIDRLEFSRTEIAKKIIEKNMLKLDSNLLFQYFQVILGLEAATKGDNSSPYDTIIANYEHEIEKFGATIVRTPGF